MLALHVLVNILDFLGVQLAIPDFVVELIEVRILVVDLIVPIQVTYISGVIWPEIDLRLVQLILLVYPVHFIVHTVILLRKV